MRSCDPLLTRFAALVDERGDRELVVARGQSWRVADLARAAEELSRRLAGEGYAEGDIVALAAPPGPALLAGFVALRQLGAVALLCDSVRPTADRLTALDRIGAVGVLSAATGWPAAAADWDLTRRSPPARAIGDPAWAVVKLTSGSTGEPRGIAVTGEQLAADDAQLTAAMELDADDRLLVAVPLSHSYGFSSLVLPALVRGARLIVPEEGAPLAAAAAHAATVFPTVPAWLAAWTRLTSPPPLPESVRLVIAAGAPLVPEVARAFRARTGRPAHVFYGASECGGIAFDRRGDAAERGTVGRAIGGVEVTIEGARGRLLVRSPAVAERYLPDAGGELGDGGFRTSDLAVIEGDEIRLLGRADDWVLVRGRNVNPREVESTLRELAGVVDAAAFGVDGPDGPRTLLRAVVAAPGGGIDRGAVLAHCRTRLAAHKVPRSVVVVDALPRSERGKLNRSALLALADT